MKRILIILVLCVTSLSYSYSQVTPRNANTTVFNGSINVQDTIKANKMNVDRIEYDSVYYDDLRVSITTSSTSGARAPSEVVVANDSTTTTGYAGSFNGASSNGTVDYYSAQNTSSQSLSMWVKLNSVNSCELMDRNGTNGFELYVNNGAVIFSADGGVNTSTNTGVIVAGGVYHIVITTNDEGSNVRNTIYINGVLSKQEVDNSQLETLSVGYIVGEWNSGGWNANGIIDDIKVYNVVLTASQVSEEYNAGIGISGYPTGITEATDVIARFKDSPTNTATLGSGYDMTLTDVTLVDGLIGSSGSFGVVSYAFEPDEVNEVFFSVQLPHSYQEGGDLYPHIHWTPSVADTGHIVVGLECACANVGAFWGKTTVNDTVLEIESTMYRQHLASDITTWSGDFTISRVFKCRFYRDGIDLRDTYEHAIIIGDIDVHYPINSIGSRNIWIK